MGGAFCNCHSEVGYFVIVAQFGNLFEGFKRQKIKPLKSAYTNILCGPSFLQCLWKDPFITVCSWSPTALLL